MGKQSSKSTGAITRLAHRLHQFFQFLGRSP
jgi:hypothetical protein